jgi:cytochrome c553
MRSVFVVATLALVPIAAIAQDRAGRNLAASCAICHGTDGRPTTKDAIPLAGVSKEHIVTQMKAFRDAKRPSTVMQQLAKGYSDEQIDQLASWFAAQKR